MQSFGDEVKHKATALKGAFLHKSSTVPESDDSSDGKPAPTKIESSGDLSLELSVTPPNGAWALALQAAEEEHENDSSEVDSAVSNEESSVINAAAPPRRRSSMPSVRIKEWKKKRERYAQDMPHTVEVFHQACFFLGMFYCTHIWSTTNRIVQAISGGGTVFPLLVLHAFFDPFQGFLNYIVYQRPRYFQIRQQSPEVGRLGAIRRTLHFSYNTRNNRSSQTTNQSRKSSMVVLDSASSRLSLDEANT
jgi:hypothetical protein